MSWCINSRNNLARTEMEWKRVICLLLTVLYYEGQRCQVKGGKDTYIKVPVLQNQSSAIAYCEQTENSELPLIGTVKYHRALTSFLRKHGIGETWLYSSRVKFPQYQWVDGSDVDPAISRLGLRLGHSCGVLDLALGVYDFLPCSQPGLSYLCEVKGCAHCTDIEMTPNNCITNGNVCYIFNCGAINWWDAEVKCRIYNGTLAIIKDKKSLKKFRSFWDNNFLGPCSNSWIGIQRDAWTHSGESSISFWANNEPQHGKDCIILSTEWDDYLWKAASCHEAHGFVCHQKAGAIDETTIEVFSSDTSIKYGNPTTSFNQTEKEVVIENCFKSKTAVFLINVTTSAFCVISVLFHIFLAQMARRNDGNGARKQTNRHRLLRNPQKTRNC